MGSDEVELRQLERDLSVLLDQVEEGGLSAAAMLGMMDVMRRHGLSPTRCGSSASPG